VIEFACVLATGGVRELERAEEVAGLLEVGAGSVDLMDEFSTERMPNLPRAASITVLLEGNKPLLDISVSTLADELADGVGGQAITRDGSTRQICWVTFVTMTKTPLLFCRSLRSCKIFRGLGAISFTANTDDEVYFGFGLTLAHSTRAPLTVEGEQTASIVCRREP